MQLLVLLLAACGQPASLPPLSEDATILAFGDSLTAGIGAPNSAGYPARLQARIGRRVVNAGVPGETSAEGLERLPHALAEHDPDLVLLCLGGNDMLRNRPDTKTRTHLAAMIERLQKRDIPVVLLAVPEPTLLGGPHPMYAALGERYGVPVVTDLLDEILHNKSLKSDAIHPNAKGYARIAAELERFLRRVGAL